MLCTDCCYALPKDGIINCTYEEGDCIITDRIKRIEDKNFELEQENKELKTVKIPQLERKIASIRGAHSVDCKKLNARTEQVERLKNENKELNDKLRLWVGTAKIRLANWQKLDNELCKAKELLSKLSQLKHRADDPFTCDEYLKLIKETETFLKEEMNHDTVKETDDRAKNESQSCEGSPESVLSAVQGKQEIQEKIRRESVCGEEIKTVTVTIDKIPHECRHTLCFDCEYCYSTKPYIKGCSRSTQKIVWNPTSKRGYCLNREENDD